MEKKTFFIVAGEASGDYHGSRLINALRREIPDAGFIGIGGDAMKAEGCEVAYHVNRMAVTGFTEVIGQLPFFYSVLKWSEKTIRSLHPSAVILVDYPDFNLRLAKRISKLKIPVIYYISPQMWAWRSGRVELVRKYIKRMFVLFPFEAEWYRERGVDAEYVGNSVLDKFVDIPGKEACKRRYGFDENERIICMMPGSRRNEIRRMLPVMRDAGERLAEMEPRCRFILPLAETLNRELFQKYFGKSSLDVEVFEKPKPDLLRAADFAWVTSGTATLETALAGTPMIIGYRTSPFTFRIARMMVDIDFIGMANLVAGRKVAEELIQGDFNPRKIIECTLPVIQNDGLLKAAEEQLGIVKDRLGNPNAAARAARRIVELVL